ncbi:hypothetical protein TanjilG_08137 [Lupinus angustifolius]|uniref:Uncharacterized protein n=1 Tax=Lupinus angustifolius TaxID=3871 RepID=A0A4P1RLP9_LUPAN|nr:hypothetical protein TanjilG_08137 [Lupinus angustifolius]
MAKTNANMHKDEHGAPRLETRSNTNVSNVLVDAPSIAVDVPKIVPHASSLAVDAPRIVSDAPTSDQETHVDLPKSSQASPITRFTYCLTVPIVTVPDCPKPSGLMNQ